MKLQNEKIVLISIFGIVLLVIGIGFGIFISPLIGLLAFAASYLILGFYIAAIADLYTGRSFWKLVIAWYTGFWSDEIIKWILK